MAFFYAIPNETKVTKISENKLCVATLTSSIIQKKKLVTDYLVAHPEGSTPKLISAATAINVNTVKSILRKLPNVTTPIRGLYKVLNGGDGGSISFGTLKAWNYHNLYISFPVNELSNYSTTLDYDTIKIRIDVNIKGVAHVCMSSEQPLPISSLAMVNDLLNAKLKQEVSMEDMQISSIEFNQDFDGYKLEGVKCMSMHTLYSQYKIYEKSHGVRVEHKTKVPFPMQYISDMLTEHPSRVDLTTKLNENTSKLTKLMNQSIYNTNQLTKLLEGMKP